MKTVKQMRLRRGMSVAEMMEQMNSCGVLGAGRMGKATTLLRRMFKDESYTVFLTLAGALVSGGLRKVIADLIEERHVDVVVTTGANMVHDLVEALGHRHLVGSFKADDALLRRKKVGRIGDIYIEQEAFKATEKWVFQLLDELPGKRSQRISSSDLLLEIGRRIEDKDSILRAAAKNDVPIISPGLPDSILGFQVWVWGQDKKFMLDTLGDVSKLVDMVYAAKKSGIIILGGGWPKHLALFANSYRGGVDSAVQITMDRPEPGGLSGASLGEAVSWSKLKEVDKAVTVVCDVTIAFPIIVVAALEQ